MNVGDHIRNSFQLTPAMVNGKKALQIGDTGSYLVRLDVENLEWSLVDRVDRDVSFDDLKASYGAWKDVEITKGALFWKKTVRPLDGVIQNDEVKEYQWEYPGEMRKFDRMYKPPIEDERMKARMKIYDIIKPDAKILVQQAPNGPIAVLEEDLECLGETYSYF